MGRPAVIDDARVLQVARELFLKKGISATTAEVAKRVGISQASIFKHFKSKQRLFFEAMQAERDRQDWLGLFERTRQSKGVEEALVALGLAIVAFFIQVLPLAMVSWSNRGSLGLPEGANSPHAGPARAAQPLVAALEAEMRAGRMRKCDAWLVTRVFIGSMQSYAMVKHLFKGSLGPPFTPEQYVRGAVKLLWEGVAPEPGGAS
jgi:AcrR family transcriptional regulator